MIRSEMTVLSCGSVTFGANDEWSFTLSPIHSNVAYTYWVSYSGFSKRTLKDRLMPWLRLLFYRPLELALEVR